MSFGEMYMDAEECGYCGLSFNETQTFIYDKYNLSQFSKEDWDALEEAWYSGIRTMYYEEDELKNSNIFDY